MKFNLTFILLFASLFAIAQKRKNINFKTGGAIPPFSTKYIDYLSYTPKFVYTPKLKEYYENKKLPFDPNSFTQSSIWIGGGLKQKPEGDYKVNFEIEDFQFNQYTEIDDDKAMIVGLKANIQVFDKENVLIYSRYMAPITKAYIYNTKLKQHQNFNVLFESIYDKLIAEFNYMYTYGPYINTNVIGLTDSKGVAELSEFENSVQVFEALKDIKRSEQGAVLDGVIEYWKPFLKYNKIKDKDRAADLRLAANYNTSLALIMQNKLVDAERLLPNVKANDRTILGMGLRDMELKSVIKRVKEYQLLSKEFKQIEAIEEPNLNKDYLYDFLLLKNATIRYDKDEEVKGTVKLLFDNPVSEYLPGWQNDNPTEEFSNNTAVAAAQIGSALLKMRRDKKVEDSNVLVEIEGKKKPKKIDLKDIESIKTESGDIYTIQVMGFGDSKRYAAVKEVVTCPKMTLYQEIFPGNEMIFKRNGNDDVLQLKSFETDKKVFKTFFKDCAKLHPLIDAGEFANASNKSYIKFMDDYVKFCCPPAKKK